MKLSAIPLFALLSAVPAAMALPAIAAHAVGPAAPAPILGSRAAKSSRELTTRDVAATVLAAELHYRICPRTTHDCPALGQYMKGTHLVLHCYVNQDTTPINGDYNWAQVVTNESVFYWVALANGKYVHWDDPLPYCIAVGSIKQ